MRLHPAILPVSDAGTLPNIYSMNARIDGSKRVWATFGLMMLIALVAWSMGSTGLALALAAGAVGSAFSFYGHRNAERRMRHSVIRHH